jgi:hypothetical protein
MTTETTVDINDDLDAFSEALFNPKSDEAKAEVKDEVEEEVEDDDVETDDDSVAHEEDTDAHEDEDEDEEAEDESDEDGDDEENQEPEQGKKLGKRNRKSARERIEELVTETRVAQREAEAFRRRIEELERKVPAETGNDNKTVELREQLPAEAPNPDALNDKGEALYPLAEFDPKYIRDLTKFTIEQEREAMRAEEAKTAQAQEAAKVQAELQTNWTTNLERASEDFPDIQEKIQNLAPVVSGLDPSYGDFLAASIMSSKFGPEIMYYLGDNIDEARKIVASGLASATREIGRLEAQFEFSTKHEEDTRNKKVSNASPPPEMRTKGNRGRLSTKADTDDLDAFSREFFNSKG